jgi:hypothetical protein
VASIQVAIRFYLLFVCHGGHFGSSRINLVKRELYRSAPLFCRQCCSIAVTKLTVALQGCPSLKESP